MPVYQYACTECGERLEVRQSFTDDALTVCPVCDGRLRKVLSAVGVVFKGSGFYRTDSRSGSDSGSSKSGTPSSGEGAKPKEGASTGDSSAPKSSDGGGSTSTSSTPSKPSDKGRAA